MLGRALILIEAPPDIQPFVVVFYQDVAVAFWPRIYLFLVSREPVNL